MMSDAHTLRSGFLRSLARFPERPCLVVDRVTLSYAELAARARSIAATLQTHASDVGAGAGRLTAVLGHRHPTAFAGLLGALLRGHGYVPLNPTFPLPRTRDMLERAGCAELVVDATASARLPELLGEFPRALVVLVPDMTDGAALQALRAALPNHRILGAVDLAPADGHEPARVSPDDVAYLLFTSGSSGRPKGVLVAHRNVTAFLDVMVQRYAVNEHDRFSHTFDLTFDLSVFDIFCAWACGACVCVPTAQQKLFPSQYVKQHALTVWFSVPSTGVLMARLGMLKPSTLPSLRYALFCGEPLPVEVAERFAEAATAAVIENLYGPTELTIACTLFRWRGKVSVAACEGGVVPIGDPYPGMRALVVDERLQPVEPGASGELLLAGPQVTLGYLNDAERTAKAFVVPPGERAVFYRTGDRVRVAQGGPLLYLGRVDNQVKIQGYRVELGEIEAVLRELARADVAIAIGWPTSVLGAEGIVAFTRAPLGIGDDEARVALGRALTEALKARLPRYMQPSRVLLIDEFPLNANGKVDRHALRERLLHESSM